ncbi:hypothetical protein [Parerythrobacter aestuarii]|uniref:hypothetical protein n=1 Tax=Parerythrobacter aestuarii TaxID=3020909 RepID=UPI0024DEF6DA|nr:hypothetical protein [Parerythrobacter aestuarii]
MESNRAPTQSASAVRWRWTYAIFAALLLATVWGAMHFTGEVDWTIGDVVAAAILFAGLGVMLEGAARIAKTTLGRTMLMFGAVLVFLLVWAELAVGLFD